MKVTMPASTALLFLLVGIQEVSFGQTVDSCMTGKGEEAITTCQQLIDNGSRTAAVYFQLSTQLYQTGKAEQALAVIDTALKLHPGNALIIDLKNRINTNLDEDQELEASKKKNETAMSRGRLKINCLTKNGNAALQACRAYLDQTNIDGDKIRARERILIAEIGTEATPTPAPRPETRPDAGKIEVATRESQKTPTTNPRPTTTQSKNTSNRADRQRVENLQTALAALGFNVGRPDGIAGRKTIAALEEFYQRSNRPRRNVRDAAALDDVSLAGRELQAAERLLLESRQLANDGFIVDAVTRLDTAQRTSVFLTVPPGYRQNLNLQIAQRQSDNSDPVPDKTVKAEAPVTKAPITKEPSTPSRPTVNPAPVNNEQFTQLLAQIKELESRFKLRKNNNQRQQQLLRATVSNLF